MTQFWFSVKEIDEVDNHLIIDGITPSLLVERFGSPLYVYLENRIVDNAQRLINAFGKYYPDYQLLYAVKANNNIHIIKSLQEIGVGADASCINEIKLAKMAGITQDVIFFSAVFPSNEALLQARHEEVILNLENISDIDLLQENVPDTLCFRINPDITACGAEGLKFAGPDAKFGIPSNQALEAYTRAKDIGVKKFGAHIMTGSNILDKDYFAKTVVALFEIIGPISKNLSIDFDFINLGGSLGIPYKPSQSELDIDYVARSVSESIKHCCAEFGMKLPKLYQEPGRYIVGDAGILLSRVNSVKQSDKIWLGIDAGMNCLVRPAMYKSYHHIIAEKEVIPQKRVSYNIVGPICENTDIFAVDFELCQMDKGDVVAILSAGAYGYGMSSQYNTQCRPAEIMIRNGEPREIRKADKFEDLYLNSIIDS